MNYHSKCQNLLDDTTNANGIPHNFAFGNMKEITLIEYKLMLFWQAIISNGNLSWGNTVMILGTADSNGSMQWSTGFNSGDFSYTWCILMVINIR